MRAAFIEGFAEGFGIIVNVVVVKYFVDSLTTNALRDRVDLYPPTTLEHKIARRWIEAPFFNQLMSFPPIGLCVGVTLNKI